MKSVGSYLGHVLAGYRDGDKKRCAEALIALVDHAINCDTCVERMVATERRLKRIIDAYDAYRGFGVSPAPDAYQALVAAINAARSQDKPSSPQSENP